MGHIHPVILSPNGEEKVKITLKPNVLRRNKTAHFK